MTTAATATDRIPLVKRNLRYVRQEQADRVAIVVKDPVRMQYFRFGEMEAWIMQQLDGTRSLEVVAEGLRQQFGINATISSLQVFVRRLKELGLAERTQEEKRLLLTEMLRRDRKLRLQGQGSTLLRMRFSLGDPDRLFDRMVGRLGFFWSPLFVALSVAAIVCYGGLVAARWEAFKGGLGVVYHPAALGWVMLPTMYVAISVVLLFHEMAHGLTCKYFGGEVHEMGTMLLYFMPAAYCNVNDAWTFERRSHRLWVTFAGGWIQLLIAFLAGLVWLLLEPGTYLHDTAFLIMVFAGGLSLVLNFNPLIPLDGYYALMDWLEIPNLRQRSFQHVAALFKQKVLRLTVPLPGHTPREGRIFLTYGVLALAYSTVLLVTIFFLLSRFLLDHLGGWGWVVLAALLWLVARRSLGRMGRVVRVWLVDKSKSGVVRRRLSYGAGGVMGLALLAIVTPWTVHARGAARIEPSQRIWLAAQDTAVVASIRVAEGARVAEGDTVAVLRSPRLELDWTEARATVLALRREIADLQARGQTGAAALARTELETDEGQLRELERRRDRLILRAPFDGYVVTPHPETLLGAGALPGDSLLELWSSASDRVRIYLSQRDAGGVKPGAPVQIRFGVLPGHTWRTTVALVAPAARQGAVELLAPLPSDAVGTALRPGMLGRAKVVAMQLHVATALARWVRQTVRLDWFL